MCPHFWHILGLRLRDTGARVGGTGFHSCCWSGDAPPIPNLGIMLLNVLHACGGTTKTGSPEGLAEYRRPPTSAAAPPSCLTSSPKPDGLEERRPSPTPDPMPAAAPPSRLAEPPAPGGLEEQRSFPTLAEAPPPCLLTSPTRPPTAMPPPKKPRTSSLQPTTSMLISPSLVSPPVILLDVTGKGGNSY